MVKPVNRENEMMDRIARCGAVFARVLLVLGGGSCLGGSALPDMAPFSHEAYVWQRRWTSPVGAAVRKAADMVERWRVLGAVMDEKGRLKLMSPDWAALVASARPVIVVVRIDGPPERASPESVRADLLRLVALWRKQEGIRLVGVEIDHDSPTARLHDYSLFLAGLKEALGGTLPLSVTALPTWLASPDLSEVLAVADESVLQVHAVSRPRPGEGLFDVTTAMAWHKAFAARTTKPYRLALPTYGARVQRDAQGVVIAVESEGPAVTGGVSTEELLVDPTEIALLLRRLNRSHPDHFQGIVWFRLPTTADRRAWSLATLRGLIAGAMPQGGAEVRVEKSSIAGMVTFALVNPGQNDVRLPRRLGLPRDCILADGANDYEFDPSGPALVLTPGHDGMIHERRRLTVGWARCTLEAKDVDVQP